MYNKDTFKGASFSLSNRLARVLWSVVYIILFKYSPRNIHCWRRFLLKCFGATVGKGVHVYPKVQIWAPWNLNLGDECGVGNGAILYSQDIISIGSRSVISQGAHLCTGTHDYKNPGFPLLTKPIIVGSNVWVAAEVFIHPGVIISDGAIIGARSVVTTNMPQWTVCAGHPCAPIKERKNLK